MPYIDLPDPVIVDNRNKADSILKKYKEAEILQDHWKPKYEEAYEYTLPQRQSFYEETPADRRTDKIFDETAVVGIQEFASRLQSGMVPTFARWANLEAGVEIPEENVEEVNEQLDGITSYIFEILSASNFNQEVHESFMDLAVGTGCLMIEEGDAINPIKFTSVPLPQVKFLNGPDNRIDTVFRDRRCPYNQINVLYPKAIIPTNSIFKNDEDRKITLIDSVYRDYSKKNQEVYKRCVILKETQDILLEEEYKGVGSNPYVVFRWNKASGEVWGRGPVFNAMSAIKTCNLTIQLILENAQMAVSGVYQIEDDGVVNTDNISLVPGTLIPIAPNSRGLMPITNTGRFDVAQLVLEDMRNNIKKALYMETLGRPEGTPMSATEVSERMADLSRQIGSSFGRLQAEFVLPVLRRVIKILNDQGRIEIPNVNGREIQIQAVSPLSRAQYNQDITDINRFNEIIGVTFGPQMLNLIVNQDSMAKHLAKLMNIPEKLLRDKAEQQQIANQMQQMAMAGQGTPPNAEQQ
jgi:hypothetical protein|tara:strand:- start:596 stop:2164 length:1569 start_codon:yes stop_codon:yes gene_type:complete